MKSIVKYLNFFTSMLVVVGCSDAIYENTFVESDDSISGTRAILPEPADYYWLGDEKIPLQKMNDKFFLIYDSVNEERIETELSKININLTDIEEDYNLSRANYARKFPEIRSATIEGDYNVIAPVLSHASYWAPYYKTEIGIGRLTDRFYIALANEGDLKSLAILAKEHSVEILGESELKGWYELACTKRSTGNALEMANLFYETGQFVSVSYDLGARGEIVNINEPLYLNGTLWHLGNNSTSPTTHINYTSARNILPQASSSVKIAVIDTGVQYNHSDFYNVLPGWDAETQSSPNIISTSHGTQVTGFIAAIPDNGKAVAGIAYGATVLPISIRAASTGAILSSATVMARAINRAVSEGANIINCSWKYPDNMIISAVQLALNSGCIVVFASGNDSGSVSSPANSDSRIIVVGALKKDGARPSFSNYGPQLDVVAPGENVTSTTLGSNYDYTTASGTSFSAPQVTAIAALILSKYPHFTQQNVIDLIQNTASRQSAGLAKDNYIGYGLVNANKALLGNNLLSGIARPPRFSNVQYKILSALGNGFNFNNWTIYPGSGYTVTGGTTSSTLNIRFSAIQEASYTITANFTLPGNLSHSVSTEITVETPMSPNISWTSGQVIWNQIVTLTASHTEPVGDYIWEVLSGGDIVWASNNLHQVQIQIDNSGSPLQVRCRAQFSGGPSEWGELTLYRPYAPAPAPAPQADQQTATKSKT